MTYKTEQEAFWAGEFGNEYLKRNNSDIYRQSSINTFSRALQRTHGINSVLELGSNIGINMESLSRLLPFAELNAVEINETAAGILREKGIARVFNESIFDFKADQQFDLTFTCGVLIHINPEMLPTCYRALYENSARYIYVNEYHNPSPVEVPYRGNSERMYKRDFAGELAAMYPDLKLIDYGFFYSKDPRYPVSDTNWFLFEKP